MQTRKTDSIRLMFDSIARSYDRLNHLLSVGVDRSWRRRSLRWVVDRSREQEILDLACGTGDYSLAIARRAHPATRVTGLDLSEGMLEVMRRKVAEAGMADRISTLVGNAEEMPFDDAQFDRVTIGFGIRNFEHRERALAEMLRVLKPGGRVVILELSVPAWQPARWCYNLYFTRVLPVVGGMVSGQRSAYSYLPASVLAFPPKEEWMATMRACGFAAVRHRALSLGICRMYIGDKPL